jgi:hypothetical protein
MTATAIKIFYTKLRNLLYNKSTSVLDYLAYQSGIKPLDKNFSFPSGLTVYYLGENLPPRIARMVKWLKREYKINAILICHINGFNAMYSNESFDNVILFRNKWHLLRVLRELPKPNLIHAFGPKSFYPDTARVYMSGTKFIYDMQDVLAIYFGLGVDIKWYQEEFPHERNCLALSDGIVSHGLEPIPAGKLYKIGKKNKRLFFPLLCDDDVFCDNRKELTPDNISIVYAGEIQGANRDKKQFGNVQFFDLIETFSAQKIHFHVYAAPGSFKMFESEYREIEKRNPYFHLETPVKQSDLPKALSQFHFGIIPFFTSNTALLHEKNYYSTALKLFNFIEAGIPVLVSEEIHFQNWIARRYKAGINIQKSDLGHLREIIEKIDYKAMAADLIKEREKLSLKKNIGRLYDFYQKVIDNKNK